MKYPATYRSLVLSGLLASSGLAAGACATSTIPDSALEGIALVAVNPTTVVPSSVLVIDGQSFVGEPFGTSHLRLQGLYKPDLSSEFDVDVTIPTRFSDFDRLEASAGAEFFTAIENLDGVFRGKASVEVLSAVDGKTYTTDAIEVELTVRQTLTPRLDTVQTDTIIFVNDRIEVVGDGLLLGGPEGTTMALVAGCYQSEIDTECRAITDIEVPVVPESPFDRSRGHFAFLPTIAGIRPGHFDGNVLLRNLHAAGEKPESASQRAVYDMIKPAIFEVGTRVASLGQFVEVRGGGFIGNLPTASTAIHLQGTFTPTGAPAGGPVDISLTPEFSSGNLVRYVMSENDALGQAVDLRRVTGTFDGTVTPVISFQGLQVSGTPENMTLGIAPMKQVIYLDFQISYVESLRNFGVRAIDSFIRERVVSNVLRDYAGINIDVRLEQPKDFALYTHVEIGGPDTDGVGLHGYDTTPGKDPDNTRLDDHIGGAEARTLANGGPGYGGLFIDTLFGFSRDSGVIAAALPTADPLFDEIFDPFRPDRDGVPIIAADLLKGVPKLPNSDACPAQTRIERIACANLVLAALVSSTVSHEIGHALGLADPMGAGLHDFGDAPNRLMDAAIDRPFTERAELGSGPARLCSTEYEYLRTILPSTQPADTAPRPSCQ